MISTSQDANPSERRSSAVRLRILRPTQNADVIQVDRAPFTMGRKSSCDHVLNHSSVSREHIRLTWEDACWALTDCGSRNGTFVNGQSVSHQHLTNGDLIQIGAFVLRFEGPGFEESTGSGVHVEQDHCAIQTRAGYSKQPVSSEHVQALLGFGNELAVETDEHRRRVALCQLILSRPFRGFSAQIFELNLDRPDEPVVPVTPPAFSENGPAPSLSLSQTVTRALRERREGVIASNFQADRHQLSMTLNPSTPPFCVIASPLKEENPRLQFIYATFPPECATEEWLTLVFMAVKVWSDADRAWTVRKEAEESLRQSEARFRIIADGVPEPIAIAHKQNDQLLFINQRCEEVFGLESDKAAAGHLRDLFVDPADHGRIRSALDQTRRANEIEARFRNADGEELWGSVTAETLDFHGMPAIFLLLNDITQQRALREHLRYLAHHDPLTGLPNRSAFCEVLRTLADELEPGERLAVACIGLDRFKTVNEILGYEAGDRVLEKVATSLKSVIGHASQIARKGGDEFLVMVRGRGEGHALCDPLSPVLERLNAPLPVDEREIDIQISAGIAVRPDHTEDVDALVTCAEAAMLAAKRRIPGGYLMFSPEMAPSSLDRLKLERKLRTAVQQNRLEVYYQPFVEAATRQIIGMEALARWTDPGAGPVSPGVFIPLAEETGVILPLGRQMLETACAQAKKWHDQKGPRTLTVNLSVGQLRRSNFIRTLQEVLHNTGFPAEYLKLEITESMMLEEPLHRILNALRELGVRLAVDDFGTGYSSLAYLADLPVGTLKIDRSFVQAAPDEPAKASIVQAMVTLAGSLGLTTIAEGVETAEQFNFLRTLHCHAIQGFYFYRPMPASALDPVLME